MMLPPALMVVFLAAAPVLPAQNLSRVGRESLDENQLAAVFDGSIIREKGVVVAADGSARPRFAPNPIARRVGDLLRAAAAARIAEDPFGRVVLARLSGPLPAIAIEDIAGGDFFSYDVRRHQIIVDRAAVTASIAADAAPGERVRLERTLSSPALVLDYLASHPRAIASFTNRNDVLLVHELTHAWQDRREPNINSSDAAAFEYELEAWTTKNLYLHSRLRYDPLSIKDEVELDDYRRMTSNYSAWVRELRARYPGSNDRRVLSPTRLARLREDAANAARESAPLLADYYLATALEAPNAVEFAARLREAEMFAVESGDARRIAAVRAHEGDRR